MNAITLTNETQENAEFRFFQGTNRIARLGVHPGGTASIPTGTQYTAQAFTTMGDFALASNSVSFTNRSIVLLAQVLAENGYYDFQLLERPGVQPNEITLENTWRLPVQFKVTLPNGPFEMITVVDEHNAGGISTAQTWSIYAIVNGITTGTVQLSDSNAQVALKAGDDRGYALTVS
jgi:hypothetical protein